jgi:hypothetical protein
VGLDPLEELALGRNGLAERRLEIGLGRGIASSGGGGSGCRGSDGLCEKVSEGVQPILTAKLRRSKPGKGETEPVSYPESAAEGPGPISEIQSHVCELWEEGK